MDSRIHNRSDAKISAPALTTQSMHDFNGQAHNHLKPLEYRVREFQNSNSVSYQHGNSIEERQKKIMDTVKDWMEEWERLGSK